MFSSPQEKYSEMLYEINLKCLRYKNSRECKHVSFGLDLRNLSYRPHAHLPWFFFFFVTRQVLIQLSQVGALLPPVSVKGSLFISSTLSSTNPTCKFQQKGFIRSNIEVFLCIYWHFILFPNAFCFEIGTKTWSVKLYKKMKYVFPSNLFKECSTYRKHK